MKAVQIGILAALAVVAGLLAINLMQDPPAAAVPVQQAVANPEPVPSVDLPEPVVETPAYQPPVLQPAPAPPVRRAEPRPSAMAPARPARTPSSPAQQKPTAVVEQPRATDVKAQAPPQPQLPAEPAPEDAEPAKPVFTPLRPDRATDRPVERRQPRTVTIPSGTTLTVRLGETLDSERNSSGDSFMAYLDAPLIVDGLVIADRRARVQGQVVEADRAGRVKGVSQLGIVLTSLETDDGQRIRINTAKFEKEGEKTLKEDAAKVGVAAGIGAAIGAIAGGGKGAAIGAAAGGAAGTGGVIATRGKEASLPSETRVTFSLSEAVTVTEKLK